MVISFICCNQRVNNIDVSNYELITIDPAKIESGIPISDYIDSVSYIILQTTTDNLIGEIKKVIQYNDILFVLDDKTNAIWKFSNKGEYLGNIQRIGKGPEEYIKINNFFISDNQLILYDSNQRKIIKYDLNGKYINTVLVGRDLIRDLMPFGDSYICYNYTDHYKKDFTRTGIWRIDSNAIFKDQILTINSNYNSYKDWPNLYTFDHFPHIFNQLTNEICYIKNDSIFLKYRFNFISLNSLSDFNGNIDLSLPDIINFSCIETTNLVISSWVIKDNNNSGNIFCFYSKDNQEVKVSSGIINDIDIIIGKFIPINSDSRRIVSVLNYNDIYGAKEFINELKSTGQFNFSNLEYVVNNVKLNDNPILQIFYTK